MEAEYSALIMALWAAIALIEVIRYVIKGFGVTKNYIMRFKTTVHEDNQGAL
jgi:hypothetical protein